MFAVALFLLFILVPLAELTLLLIIADLAGHWWVSLVIVILTGILGAALARFQGAAAWRRLVHDIRSGQLPTDSALDAVLILVAGTLLITPGVLTDLLGVSLLVPWTRAIYRERIKKWAANRFRVESVSMDSMRSQIIDSYVVDADSEPVDQSAAKPVEKEG